MISRKYLSDYKVVKTTDEKGRVRSEAVYIGGDFSISPPVSRKNKRLILILTILLWPALIGALIPVTHAVEITYVILPYVCAMLPMFFMTGAAITFVWEKDIMTREQAEKIAKRLPPCAFGSLALSGIAFLGEIVTAFISWGSFHPGDIIFAALSGAICAATVFIFLKCRKIKALRTDYDD